MKFEKAFTDEEFALANTLTTPPELEFEGRRWGVESYGLFFEEYLRPALEKRGGARSDRERAVTEVLWAMAGFLLCISRLTRDWHLQGLASCSRSMFELFVDLHLLTGEAGDLSCRRYTAFSQVDKLQKARMRVQFFAEHPEFAAGTRAAGIATMKEFIQQSGAEIDSLRKELWPDSVQSPGHWSGSANIFKRAKKAGLECERLAYEHYPILSWFVHTASVGVRGLDRAGVQLAAARALDLVREVLIPAFTIVASECELDVENLSYRLAFLDTVHWQRITAVKLSQPERFDFRGRVS